MSLEELVSTWDPVRITSLPAQGTDGAAHVPRDEAVSTANITAEAATQGVRAAGQVREMSVPKELWRTVDALFVGGGISERDVFQMGADPSEVATIRECLDRGEDFPPQVSPHALAAVLTGFVSALPAPIIPTELCPSPVSLLKH